MPSDFMEISTTRSTCRHVKNFTHPTEQLIFLCLLFLFILVCNVTVLILIFMTRKRRSRMNIFIANLALADLMVGFFFVLLDIIEKQTEEWQAGVAMCKIVRFIQGIAFYGSTYALVALSIDRLDSIARPLQSMSKGRRVKILIVSQWAFAVLFSFPMFRFDTEKKVIHNEEKVFCMINFPAPWAWKLYLTLVATAVFIIPAILIAICYIIIVVIIWKRSSSSFNKQYSDAIKEKSSKKPLQNKKEVQFEDGTDVTKSLNATTTYKMQNASSGIIPKAKIKTIKMTFVIVLAFIFCWLPYFVYDFYQLYGSFNVKEMKAVTIFIQSLAPLNSAANPVIFLIFNYNSYMSMCRNGLRNQIPMTSMTHV
ncbi:cardioacceleratory peptide receptor-like isoform X1 [Crassostrea virginica]